MNIFYLDPNIERCARYHCDKHVVKMVLETAQILCTVHHNNGSGPDVVTPIPYRATHKDHPSVKWAGESFDNYWWLTGLGTRLILEYEHRYKKDHASVPVILWCRDNWPMTDVRVDFTPPPQCMPDIYKVEGDTVEAYRRYYRGAKRHLAKWTNRPTPEWFNEEIPRTDDGASVAPGRPVGVDPKDPGTL